jgi:hypothetical protein
MTNQVTSLRAEGEAISAPAIAVVGIALSLMLLAMTHDTVIASAAKQSLRLLLPSLGLLRRLCSS